jgi:hypothetical protein
MTRTQCPPEIELVRFVDADLAPETLERVKEHLSQCQLCSEQVKGLHTIAEDIGVTGPIDLDLAAHVKNVMRRLDVPAARQKRPQSLERFAAIAAVAASVALVTHVVGSRRDLSLGTWQARGSSTAASLSRDIGVQVYTLAKSLQPLHPGDIMAPDTALTAGLRNLGNATAYVLLFAIDSRHAVHWITPKYTRADENPAATELTSAPNERVLPTSVVFDDMAPGPLRIVTIVSSGLLHVSQVESLPESELNSGNLAHHFVGAEVREIIVEVEVAHQGNAP